MTASEHMVFEMNSTMNGNEGFSCSMSNLSSSKIVDRSFWIINQNFIFGIPLVAVLKLFVFLLTFMTYMFLTVMVIVKKRLRQQRNQPLILNIGITGILNSATILLFGIAFEISPNAEFVYGGSDTVRCGVCTFAGFLFVLFNTVLLYTLAVYSIVRFILLVFVFSKIKIHYVRLSVVLIWFISFWIAISPVAGFGLYEFDRDFGACIPRLTGNSKTGVENRSYVAFLFLGALVPLSIIIFTNVITCRILLRHVKRTKNEAIELIQKQTQNSVEIFIAFWIASILWIPIIIVTFVMIATSPETFSKELYVTCWLLYLCNPLLLIAEIMHFVKWDF